MKELIKKSSFGFLALAMLLAAGGITGCQNTGSSQPQMIAQAPPVQALPAMSGPKRTISVGKFDAIGAFTSSYGGWDIGGGLAAMLTTALLNSGRFVVIERAELSEVLSEQELSASGMVNPATAPKLGRLSGVQLLIYGAVTEFGAQESGGGLSMGISGIGGLPFAIGGANQSASGTVAMDIRIVDTTTGEILESRAVRKNIESSAFNLSVGYSGMSIGGNQFNKTPLGQAVRGAITKAVQYISLTANDRPWTGRVVDMDGKDVVINAGARSGIKTGDMFMIERVTKTFTDPSTGQVLGSKRKELGVLRLSSVQEKMAFGGFSPFEKDKPKRGDMVFIMK